MFVQIMNEPAILVNVFHIKSIEPEYCLQDGNWVYRNDKWLVHVGEKTYRINKEQKDALMNRLTFYQALLQKLAN